MMSHTMFRFSLVCAVAFTKCAAFGQGGWSELPPSLVALPAKSPSTPWQRVAQTPPIAPTASPVAASCTPGCRSIEDWTNCPTPSTFSGQATYSGQTNLPANCDLAGSGFDSCRPRNPWYFSAAGLVMGRGRPSRVWTTYETNNNPNQTMSTDDANPNWQGGFEAHIGRQIACGAYAVDLGYWRIDNLDASSSQTHTNTVSTPLLFNDLEFGAGDPVQDYFDSAEEHRISRRNTIQNIELNLLEATGSRGLNGVWRSRKSVGVRYFRFDEDLSLSTLDLGGTWGGNSGADEVTMRSSTENNLIGVQLGYQLDRQWGQQTTFFIAPKFGIYNNRIEHQFDLRRGDGVAAGPTAFSGVSGGYPVESSTNEVSFLTEVNLGFSWQPTRHWSLFGGYRVVALTGMALADSQIPQYIVDIPEIADIDYQDSLILHGAFFGAAYSL